MDTKAIAEVLGQRFDAVAADGARAIRDLALPAGAAILDVGTGSGYFAIYLASQGYEVITGEPESDKSQYAGRDWASNAQKAGVFGKIRFQSFDASMLPFESGTFDAVFFFGVLHHIDENVRARVCLEALRVSKENGAVVFFEPRKEMLDRLWVDDPGHPLAANPSHYVPRAEAQEYRMEGRLMDIFIYRKTAARDLSVA
jgi:SAM-dependent methyltransferase